MARTKSTRPVRKSTAAPTSTVVPYSTAGLNRRILAVLKSTQELKRYSSDGVPTIFGNQTDIKFYVNFLSGIVQGTASNQRIGDQITVEKVLVNCRIIPMPGLYDDLTWSARTSILGLSNDSYQNSIVTTWTPSPAVTFGGYPSIGPINDMDYKVYADKRKITHFNHDPQGTIGTGEGILFDYFDMKKTFTGGKKITYEPGTNRTAMDNMVLSFSADNAGNSGTGVDVACKFFLNWHVFYRDA